MKNTLRVTIAVLALTIALSSCVNESANVANTNTTTTTANANVSVQPQPTPQTSKASASDENAMPVTLPVLDAFFADETFASALKSKVQLTDEQIERLRQMAREETSKLRETDADEPKGKTAAARAHASEQIKAIIGDEKAQQLALFLRQRWSGDEEGSEKSDAHAQQTEKANNVPTDTRIVVNSPAYRMDVFENGQLIKSYRIGIGYPEFPLPTGMRKANTIIFNPTWTPPDEPWVESSNKVKPGQKIEAGSKLNPLGPIKIPIGLPSLIHGGKSPAKLGGFASHGCVGLTTPQVQDFSRLLARLSGTELTDEQLAAYAKNPTETKSVKLGHAVTVELRYETIVVEDGKLHIYRDVYDRNTNTEENLRAALAAYGVTLEQLSAEERAQITKALEEMSLDANGQSDEKSSAGNANSPKDAKQGAAANAKAQPKDAAANGQVTRVVKGKKEIVIEIAALKDKGYPAPVELDTGSGVKRSAAAATKGKRS